MSLICYVEGNSFPSIFGGRTPCAYASICQWDDAVKLKRNPRLRHMIGMFNVHDGTRYHDDFDTLEEAKAYCTQTWPGCTFKTPAEYREEG